jgi:hypothetical protein
MHTLKAVYPLLTLGALPAHIEHVVGQLAKLEKRLGDASRP